MRNTWLVALREFRQRVTSRGFLLGAFGLPLILLAGWLLSGVFVDTEIPDQPSLEELIDFDPVDIAMGFVDRADVIQVIPEPVPEDAVRSYPDVETARAALDREEISAYYVVPEDYRETGEIQRFSPRLPVAPPDTQLFDWVLVRNLFPDAELQEIARWRRPLGVEGPLFVSTETDEVVDAPDMALDFVPFLVTMAIMIPLFTGGGYLLESLTKEKGSRIMEILLVSLRPRQLLTGKLFGLAALVLVQYAIWVVFGAASLLVTGQELGQLLGATNLEARDVALILPYALGGFGIYAALMAGIGALAMDVESAGTWTFVLTFPMMLPIFLWVTIVNAPHATPALALSLFPYSAPITMIMRMTATTVPAWQHAVSLGLLLFGTAGTLLLMARLFRAQTLLSGESLSLKRFWAALTGP